MRAERRRSFSWASAAWLRGPPLVRAIPVTARFIGRATDTRRRLETRSVNKEALWQAKSDSCINYVLASEGCPRRNISKYACHFATPSDCKKASLLHSSEECWPGLRHASRRG